MGMEMGLWRADGNHLTRTTPTAIGLEAQLESYIESDPSMLGETLLIIGRQVPTAHGGFIDLLAVDETAAVHVIELKRDRTPRKHWITALGSQRWVEQRSLRSSPTTALVLRWKKPLMNSSAALCRMR